MTFSGTTWSDGEICKPCHTPHHSANLRNAPLWNHELSAVTYTLYSSPTMDAIVGHPGPASKVCLSCHDAHNAANLPNLVRITMTASELCLTCHNAK